MNGIIYGYARVSTYTQAVEGNSLDAQRETLKSAGAERIYCDAFTGRSMDRPEWNKLRRRLEPGDTLIVTKLDRLGRSVGQTAALIDELLDYGVTVNVLNLGVLSADKDNPANTLIRNIMLAFAEYERDMIVQRTQEGKAIARQKPGYREGRPPKYSKEQLDHAMDLLADHSYKQTAAMTGISESTLTRERRKRNLTKS